MRLCVLGTGYVGLVAGAGFADFGNDVVCVDIDADKVARLQKGELPIYEPGLDRLVAHNVAERRLSFSTDVAAGVRRAEVVFIAVGTPQGEDGSADLQYVLAAAAEVGRSLTGFTVIVNKSTVPVGSADKVRAVIAQHAQQPFAVVSNPEFLKEGDAVADFMNPDRVIIGTGDADEDRRARDIMRHLYNPFVRTNDRILLMDTRSAELTKYASNAFLATRISFMNEMANLCEGVGADVEMVRRGIGMDQRIGPKFLFPGIGYGGSCFPKDVQAVLATARDVDGKLEIVEAVHRVNQRQKERLFDKMARHFAAAGDVLQRKKIAVWGLAFKPGTDDIREAPSLVIIHRLLQAGAELHVHDPVANSVVQRELERLAAALAPSVTFHDHNYDTLPGAHALVLCTEWHEFRRPDFQRIKEAMAQPVLFDGRNIWDPAELRGLGFTYYGIGRR